MNKNTKAVKLYPDSFITLKKIGAKRYYEDLDTKELSPARLVKAALRIPGVKEVLLKARIDAKK